MTERPPLFVPEVSCVLDNAKPYFDDTRSQALEDMELAFTAETMGMRGLLYTSALRKIAEMRHADRQKNPDLDPCQWLMQRNLARVAMEYSGELAALARRLGVINTAEQALALQESSFIGGLRPHQHPYLHDIIHFMDTAPSHITYDIDSIQHDAYIQGATVEAPTGVGKTVLIARTLVAMGVGRPIESLPNQTPVRALLIVPTQDLVEQSIGMHGDDTLRRFAPEIGFGGYYQFQKDLDADVTVITIDQFIKDFRNGQLHGRTFDMCLIDEAHHLTQPLFKETLLTHWQGGPVIGFTATPDYDEQKDVRNLLPYRIFHGDILDYIQSPDDVLNAAQLFMLRVLYDHYLSNELLAEFREQGMTKTDIEQYVVREATAEFLEPYLAEGRRGLVFCEQGGREPSHYAKLMAARLAEITLPNGQTVRTATAGTLNAGMRPSNPQSNSGIRRRYRQHELEVITTVRWGTEALNEDIDFVIAACNVTSLLKKRQLIGRGVRLSHTFPITIYAHIFSPSPEYRNTNRFVTLFEAMGLENVEQGIIIGAPGQQPRNKYEPHATPNDPTDTKTDHSHSRPQTAAYEMFPQRIRAILADIDTKTVAEALVHPDVVVQIPKDYKDFQAIMHDVPGSRSSILRHLRETMGFRSVSRYEKQYEFVTYFEPKAEEYLNQFRGAVARVDLQREFDNVDVTVVDKYALAAGVSPFDWLYDHGQMVPHFKPEDAAKIKALFFAVPAAEATDYTRVRLAEEAGVPDSSLMGRLTADERAKLVPRRTRTATNFIRVLEHWTQEDAQPIISRLKRIAELGGKTPPHVVPALLVVRRVPVSRDVLGKLAQSYGLTMPIVRHSGPGRPPRCAPWQMLQRLEQEFGVRPQAAHFTIDYSRLPQSEQDTDPNKIAYATQILAQLEATSTEGLRLR